MRSLVSRVFPCLNLLTCEPKIYVSFLVESHVEAGKDLGVDTPLSVTSHHFVRFDPSKQTLKEVHRYLLWRI